MFDETVFTEPLRRAKVIPLYTEWSKIDINYYRPISLLTVWSWIVELVMYNQKYIYQFPLLYENQFGFRSKLSKIDASVELTEKKLSSR